MLGDIAYSLTRETLNAFGVRFLTMNEIDNLIDRLATDIGDAGVIPDAVVGIMTSGCYLGRELAKRFRVEGLFIDVSKRKRNVLGVNVNDLPLLPRFLKWYIGPPRLQSPFVMNGVGDRILLVDDDCVSGQTMNIAEREIRKYHPLASIVKATLFSYRGRAQPDFCSNVIPINGRILRSRARFPWAPYSPCFGEYIDRMQKAISE